MVKQKEEVVADIAFSLLGLCAIGAILYQVHIEGKEEKDVRSKEQ